MTETTLKKNTGLMRLLRDILTVMTRQGFVLVFALLTSVILARGLGRDDRGVFALVILLPNLLTTFLDLGIGASVIYFIAREEFSVETVVQGNTILCGIISVVCILFGIVISHAWREVLFPGVSLELLLLGLFTIPFILYRNSFMLVFRGLQNYPSYNLVATTPQLVTLILTFVLVWLFHLDVAGAVVAVILGNMAAVVVAIWQLRKLAAISRFYALSIDRKYLRAALNYGIRNHLSNVMAFLNYRVDVFLLGIMTSTVSVGLYDVAVTLVERLWVVTAVVSEVLFPRVAALKDYDDQRNQLTTLVSRHVLWISIVTSLLIYVFAEWGIVFLYGEEFRSSALALQILLPGIAVMGMAKVLGSNIAGRGKPEVNSLHSGIGLITNIALNLVLIPRLGFLGAAFATTISYSIWAFVKVWAYSRLTATPWQQTVLINRQDIALWRTFLQRFRNK